MIDRPTIWLLAGVLLVNTAAHQLCWLDDRIYFIGDAISWVLCLLLVVRLTRGVARSIAAGILLLAISNLLDELLFDPVHVGFNEYIITALAAVWTINNIRRCLTSNRK